MPKNTKELIQQTAFQMFSEFGYQNTTLRMIAEQCEITHVNVLYHFKNKHELGIRYLQEYAAFLVERTMALSKEIHIEPSVALYGVYWYLHDSFIAGSPQFADTYFDILNEDRDVMPALAIRKTSENSGRNEIVNTILGRNAFFQEPELSLNMYMLTEADLRLVRMLRNREITPIQAVKYYLNSACLLLLNERMTENQAEEVLHMLRQVDCSKEQNLISQKFFVQKC